MPAGEPDEEKEWVLDRSPLCGTELKSVKRFSSWKFHDYNNFQGVKLINS
ncbi:MAG: hypothetical protein ACTSWN_05795 [Promethearchaeota archaeon]